MVTSLKGSEFNLGDLVGRIPTTHQHRTPASLQAHRGVAAGEDARRRSRRSGIRIDLRLDLEKCLQVAARCSVPRKPIIDELLETRLREGILSPMVEPLARTFSKSR
jgi:hypothetical protein